MEGKAITNIITSCQFPMVEYKINVKYNEVRKASGIAYILLELIQNKALAKEKLAEVLLQFGIPKDLQYLFTKELASLVNNEILSMQFYVSYLSNQRYFKEMQIEEFTLTDKGKKLFSEGAIPTGTEKSKSAVIFFSPVTRKFDTKCTLPYANIDTSFLGNNFLDEVKMDIGGLEEYLKLVQMQIGLKKEERIVSFEIEQQLNKAAKKEDNLTISISTDGVVYGFATSDEKVFFDKYYSSALMTSALLAKDNYKFTYADKSPFAVQTVKFSELKNINSLYIPSDLSKQAARPCNIFVCKENNLYERTDNTHTIYDKTARELLSSLSGNVAFCMLDLSGCKAYSPVNIQIPCQQFGDVLDIQLLVEQVILGDEFENILTKLYKIYADKEFDSSAGKVILFVADALKDSNYLINYANSKLSKCKTVDEKIEQMLLFNSVFKKISKWQQNFAIVADSLFDQSAAELELDNVIYKNTILTPLKRELNMSGTEYIKKFSKKLLDSESIPLVYQALESANFSTEEILSVVNVVPVFMQCVLENEPIVIDSKIAVGYGVLQGNLWKLNKMLGIESEKEYSLRDDYNVEEFFNAFATFSKTKASIDRYKQYDKEGYERLNCFNEIYMPIQDILSIERTAVSHPEKISKKYVEDEIARGKYKDAICDLLIKLQYDLRKLLILPDDTQANDLIDEAVKKKVISSTQATELHHLRMCRNGFQHPERKQIEFNREIINNWKNIVFSIKEDT